MTTSANGSVLDPAPNPPSPKVIGAGVAALLVPAILAALMYLNTDDGSQVYASLPILAIVAIKSVITGAITFIVGNQISDPKRLLDLANSPKVLWATGTSIIVTAAIDVGNYLLSGDGKGLYEAWNPIAVVAFLAFIPAATTFLAGFVVNDPARITNDTPVATIPASAYNGPVLPEFPVLPEEGTSSP